MLFSDAMKGLLIGSLFGACVGFGASTWLFEETFWFAGDMIVISAAIFAIGGLFVGQRIVDFISEYWHWFT